MNDIEAMLPHGKKDAKLDAKSKLHVLNELADLNNCNNCIFFEVRKRQDLYMWISKTPNGPSAKLHVQNVHTMDELKMTGNCLKGSRPLLSFDKAFDNAPHLQIMKEMLTHTFGVPKGARRSKPFVDHVITFSIADNKIWFRNFQIIEKDPVEGKSTEDKDMSLIEIGPRFVMTMIRLFEGSFGGATVFENPEFVTPNAVRSAIAAKRADKYLSRVTQQKERDFKLAHERAPEDPLESKKVFT